ncbi:TetR/AcrR family transcriptional regulator [Pseudovibrio sp. WM33]|uniref:TetR/AcrR family transcriptional regulator n=1 Tax=Pseudovibrio sp. WM33 TaxID=1735585 RepID=UPI0007AE9163|nr:TetR family transcriptional regulator [Pseudovibrio sp. WM33]KZL26622.1 HTH-type transcriptional repressor ComR [Pseudovibrio sp. WM33]
MDSDTINFTETFPQSMQEALKASLKVFWRLGVHRTSIDDVCRQSGVSYHFLNENFESKEHLYRTAVMWYLDQYGRQLLSGFAMHSNPVEAIRIALYECIGLFCENDCPHGSLLSVELMEISDTDGVIVREIAHLKEQVHGRIYQKLENCKKRFTSGFNPNELAEFYTEVMIILIKQACDGVDRTNLYNLADASLERLENQPVIH